MHRYTSDPVAQRPSATWGASLPYLFLGYNLQTVAIVRPSLVRLWLGQRLTMGMPVAMAMAVDVAAPMARHDMIVAAAETVALHPTVAVALAIAMHTTRTCKKPFWIPKWIPK